MDAHISNPTGQLVAPDASVALQVLPWTDWDSVNPIVKQVLARIDAEPGIRYEVGAFETVMEGELGHLLRFAAELVRMAGELAGAEVFCVAKIMYAPSGKGCGINP